MKKKIAALTLASLLALGSFAGCGLPFFGLSANNESSSAVPDAPQTAVPQPVPQTTTPESAAVEKGTSAPADEAPVEIYEEPEYAYEEAVTLDGALEAEAGMYAPDMYAAEAYPYYEEEFNTEEYKSLEENGFRSVLTSPLSTFAADVDTASYSNLRRMILNDGYTLSDIPSGAVRTEEMINYFKYDYDGPKQGEPFGINAEIAPCPWNEDHELLMLGLQTEAIDLSDAPESNLVFLIDTSGSMYEDLDLLKDAFKLLVDELDEKDTVSIVTYAGTDEVLLSGVSCDRKGEILEALDSLESYGSTNGAAGIKTAYELAADNFIKGGNNRVILATDGDLNVGVTSESELHDLITEEAKTGVFLSVLGFGYGNYSDANLETLADNGNGNYSYIDSISEAKKVLVEELGSTLLTVAKDVKLQVEFNPENVSKYRLIGYENRTMAAEDFDDDTKDGGEIGAGHSVTVLYELIPAGTEEENERDESTGKLRYQDRVQAAGTGDSEQDDSGRDDSGRDDSGHDYSDEWLTLSVRYKEPDGDTSELLEYQIGNNEYTKDPSDNFNFAAGVAEFGMVLHDSEYIGDGNLEDTYKLLKSVKDTDEYQDEFIYMINRLKRS